MEASILPLAEFAASLRWEQIPSHIRSVAAERVLDTVSVGLACAKDPLVERIMEEYGTISGMGGCATIWGCGKMAPLSTAVFINALMCHVLELDDVHSRSKAHIGAVVIPAAWALTEQLGKTAADFLTAVVAGYEVESRIAMAFGVKEHRKQGWHVSATAGVFGAAAACGSLLAFDRDTMASCLGLAGAQSFGNWAFLAAGSNCKALNLGRSAASGCEAAILAKAGMRGPVHILDAEDGGLFHMMTDKAYPEHLNKGLGEIWEISQVDTKTYPCCRSTHCAVDSVLAILEKEKIKPEEVEEILVSTYLIGKQQCACSEASLDPQSGAEAKFSTPYCVAAALSRGRLSLDEFREETVADPAVRQLMRRVTVEEDPRFTQAYPAHWGCHTNLICKNTSYELDVLDASGSVVNPLTKEKQMGKAVGMIEHSYPKMAGWIAQQLLALDRSECLPVLADLS